MMLKKMLFERNKSVWSELGLLQGAGTVILSSCTGDIPECITDTVKCLVCTNNNKQHQWSGDRDNRGRQETPSLKKGVVLSFKDAAWSYWEYILFRREKCWSPCLTNWYKLSKQTNLKGKHNFIVFYFVYMWRTLPPFWLLWGRLIYSVMEIPRPYCKHYPLQAFEFLFQNYIECL